MEYISQNNSVLLKGINDFNCTHTFDCGQCFRWEKQDDGSYTGVAFGKVVNVSDTGNGIVIKNTTVDDVENIWVDYLDLKRDYNSIKNLYINDKNLKSAMDFGFGIKILKQEIFECLLSFIISTQNGIPRIKKIVSKLSSMYGDKIEFEGKEYYCFPTPEQLKGITEKDLEPLKAGYRAAYIVDCVNKVVSGETDLEKISLMDTDDARKELLKIKGVGPKVADCVMLFSMGKYESFPIDVWVKRTMSTLYLDENASINEIQKYAKENFGKYAGMAQQYLFYYARENW